jgi:hypothetical protein
MWQGRGSGKSLDWNLLAEYVYLEMALYSVMHNIPFEHWSREEYKIS